MHVALLALVLVLPAAGSTSTSLERGTATIDRGTAAPVVVQVQVARTRPERQRGLMHRRSLPARAGMVFVFPRDVRGGFWMKNTLIPLDIAFYDRRGKIRRILTMKPCRVEPCRIYDPAVSYRAALEVNAGSFRRWNVKVGGKIVVRVTRSASRSG